MANENHLSLKVIKRSLKSCFNIPLICEKNVSIRFTPYYWPLAFQNFVTSKRITFQNFWKYIQLFEIAILFSRRKSSKRSVVNDTELNGLNLFLRIKGIVEQGLANLFITSSSSHLISHTAATDKILKTDIIVYYTLNVFNHSSGHLQSKIIISYQF